MCLLLYTRDTFFIIHIFVIFFIEFFQPVLLVIAPVPLATLSSPFQILTASFPFLLLQFRHRQEAQTDRVSAVTAKARIFLYEDSGALASYKNFSNLYDGFESKQTKKNQSKLKIKNSRALHVPSSKVLKTINYKKNTIAPSIFIGLSKIIMLCIPISYCSVFCEPTGSTASEVLTNPFSPWVGYSPNCNNSCSHNCTCDLVLPIASIFLSLHQVLAYEPPLPT